jgi:hypothetical protein
VGKASSTTVTFTITDAQGGTNRILSGFLLTIGAMKNTATFQKSAGFGLAWEASLPTGVQVAAPIAIGGLWDDAATPSPHTVLLLPDINPALPPRNLIITLTGASIRTYTTTCFLESYSVIPKNLNLAEFGATLLLTGSAVWS